MPVANNVWAERAQRIQTEEHNAEELVTIRSVPKVEVVEKVNPLADATADRCTNLFDTTDDEVARLQETIVTADNNLSSRGFPNPAMREGTAALVRLQEDFDVAFAENPIPEVQALGRKPNLEQQNNVVKSDAKVQSLSPGQAIGEQFQAENSSAPSLTR